MGKQERPSHCATVSWMPRRYSLSAGINTLSSLFKPFVSLHTFFFFPLNTTLYINLYIILKYYIYMLEITKTTKVASDAVLCSVLTFLTGCFIYGPNMVHTHRERETQTHTFNPALPPPPYCLLSSPHCVKHPHIHTHHHHHQQQLLGIFVNETADPQIRPTAVGYSFVFFFFFFFFFFVVARGRVTGNGNFFYLK